MCATEVSEWYEGWFDEDYLALYAHRDVKEAQDFVDMIWSRLKLRPGMLVADVPCGAGRHSLAFAQKGARVAGVDLSIVMLARAAELAKGQSALPLYVRGDLRHTPLTPNFDVAASIFSSLGYFESETDNHAAFSELARIVAPGGTLILDVINPDYLRAHFIAGAMHKTRVGDVTEKRELDPEHKRVVKQIEIRHGQETRTIRESVRIYERPELEKMAEENKLRPIEFWGDYDGTTFAPRSPRLIMLARKLSK